MTREEIDRVSFWKRRKDGQIFILVSADGMLDVVILKGKEQEFTISFEILANNFEHIAKNSIL